MWTDPYDDEFVEYIGGRLVTPQQAYIKEIDRSTIENRIVIEFHSEAEEQALIGELETWQYVAAVQVKVCGMGSCGTTVLWSRR